MKTKVIKSISFILALSITASCHSLNSKKNSGNNPDLASEKSSAIVATYKDGEVTLKDVEYEVSLLVAKNEKLKGLTFDKLNTNQKEAIVKEVVLKEMAFKEARKRNLNKDKDYQEVLKNFETSLSKQKLVIALAKESSSEEKTKKSYDEMVAKLKNKKDLRISYIALNTKKEAEEVYNNLVKSPKSFAAQAKKKSIDKEIAKKGGDLGFVVEDLLPADVLKQTKTLKNGEISKPFSSNNKWLIVKYNGSRNAEVLAYEKVKNNLAQNLAKKSLEEFNAKSLNEAKINMNVK